MSVCSENGVIIGTNSSGVNTIVPLKRGKITSPRRAYSPYPAFGIKVRLSGAGIEHAQGSHNQFANLIFRAIF